MNRKAHRLTVLLVALSLIAPGLIRAQSQTGIAGRLNAGYDYLEQGKFDQAQQIFAEVLRQDPGHPLALNNLAAIMVKKGNYDQALACLKRALPRSKGLQGGAQPGVQCRRGVRRLPQCAKSSSAPRTWRGWSKNLLMVEMARSSRPGKK